MTPCDQAVQYIIDCCPDIGALWCLDDDPWPFLKTVSTDIEQSQPTRLFPERYKEHVAYAIDMVASHGFTTPPAAVASVYLATRFEYYFRVLSGRLNEDGTWISDKVWSDTLGMVPRAKEFKRRVNSVSLAYDIMMLNTAIPVAQRCGQLDSVLHGRRGVRNVGHRIEFARNHAGHGHWGDISSEAVFYGLLTAVMFYSQEP